jgi:hypothetical protein
MSDLEFISSIGSNNVKIFSKDIEGFVQVIFDAVKYQKIPTKDIVNNYVNTDDTDTFIKCFNIVSKLDISPNPLKVWIQKESNVCKINCSSLENYITNGGTNFTICSIENDFIVFEVWHMQCCCWK